jgi:hypothetical protein
VLQAVITRNAVTVPDLAERLGQANADVKLVIDDFVDDELLRVDHEEVGEGGWEEQLVVTMKGLTSLEHWQFEADGVDEEGGAQA